MKQGDRGISGGKEGRSFLRVYPSPELRVRLSRDLEGTTSACPRLAQRPLPTAQRCGGRAQCSPLPCLLPK